MKYHSILFDTQENDVSEAPCSMPEFFADLNLDQIIEGILADREEYKLNTFFYTSLKSISTINFRLEVMRELEDTAIYDSIVSFSGDMKKVREFTGYSRELHNRYQREKWLLWKSSGTFAVYRRRSSAPKAWLHFAGVRPNF